MDEKILLGGAATLAVATIIAIVTLAFKNPPAYMKLSKVLLAVLALGAAFYIGYGVGLDEGARLALSEISSGKPAAEIRTLAPVWPFTALCLSFTALITLQWFPQYLGINGADKQADKSTD